MRTAPGAAALALLALTLGTTQFAAAQPAKPKLTVKETVVGKLDKDYVQAALSPDGSRMAVLVVKGQKRQVLVDGAGQAEYEWIIQNSLRFSADSKRVAYIAQPGDKVVAVIDGRESKPYREIVQSTVIFAPEGSRYAYFAKEKADGKAVVVVDEKEGTAFDKAAMFQWSPQGTRFAYYAENAGKQFFVVDGQPQPEFEQVSAQSFTFSPDGKRFAYAAFRDKKVVMVVDGKEQGKPYEDATRPVFSPDGSKIVFIGSLPGPATAPAGAPAPAKRSVLVVNGAEDKVYDVIVPNTIVFSPDSKRLAYAVVDKTVAENKLFYVIDGQPLRRFYDQIRAESFIFSADSKRYSFQVVQNNQVSVVIDGTESRPFENLLMAGFSPDGAKHTFIGTRAGMAFVVTEDKESSPYNDLGSGVIYSKDGKRTAWVAVKNGKTVLVLDGTEGNPHDGLIPSGFSADGKYFLYEARRADRGEKPFLAVQGAAGAAPEEVAAHGGTLRGTRATWTANNALVAFVVKQEKDVKDKADIVKLQVDVAP